MRVQPQVSHFVDDAYVGNRAGVVIAVICPRDASVIATVRFATPSVANAPLSSAAAAPGARDWTRSLERSRLLRRAVDRAIGQLRAGTCRTNGYNMSPVDALLGDVMASGVGRENSPAAVVHHTQVKPVHVDMGKVGASW